MTGLWVLVVALIVATGLGLWYQRVNGRIREAGVQDPQAVRSSGLPQASHDDPPASIEADAPSAQAVALSEALDGRLGDRATMVQFSSAFCQPCRATRRILEEVSAMVPGVNHVELDAEENLDLVRELDIRRTPTVLFLDARGEIRKHASGQPRKADVIAALGDLMPDSGTPDFEI